MDKLLTIINNQMLAALGTLEQSIRDCPDDQWKESHGDAPFCQVIFHTLFYVDFYLTDNEEEFKAQDFHRQNQEMFRDYEELEYKKAQNLYTKKEIENYFDFCLKKTEETFNSLKEDELYQQCREKEMPRLELAINTIRHVQHHAAQLGLRIQGLTGKELRYLSSGRPS
jgi:hypothetical protein